MGCDTYKVVKSPVYLFIDALKKKKRRYIVPAPPLAPDWNKPEELNQFQDNELDWSQPGALAQVAVDCGLAGDDDEALDWNHLHSSKEDDQGNAKLNQGRNQKRAV